MEHEELKELLIDLRKEDDLTGKHSFSVLAGAIPESEMEKRFRSVTLNAGEGLQIEPDTALKLEYEQTENGKMEEKEDSRLSRRKKVFDLKLPTEHVNLDGHLSVGDTYLFAKVLKGLHLPLNRGESK